MRAIYSTSAFTAGYTNHFRNFKQEEIELKELGGFEIAIRGEVVSSKLSPQDWCPK